MEILLIILASVAAFILLLYAIFFNKKKRRAAATGLNDNERSVLKEYVSFYNELGEVKKKEFENRMQHFLATTKITGINTDVEDLDKILIAASAIIPIFSFSNWEYMNLHEVLLYPDSFNETFEQQGAGRNTLGVVGTGAYQNMMILSKHELRQGFTNKSGKTNTAIHEFVHLVDKTDGMVDGVPEFLVSKQYVLPWLNLVHKKINEIVKNKSDINPYGATNEAEFFAVVSEYFFERPDLLQEKHPELYEILTKIFRHKSNVSF
jgi:Mlc titration factor MtfA (ptsG expression regulator)